MDTQHRLQQLRHLLYEDPCPRSWAALCHALDQWPHQEASLALDYAGPHLQSWPAQIRVPPAHWRLARLHGRTLPWWPLTSAWHVLVREPGPLRIQGLKLVRQALGLSLRDAMQLHLYTTPYPIAFACDLAQASKLHGELLEIRVDAHLVQDQAQAHQRWDTVLGPGPEVQVDELHREALRNPMLGAVLQQAHLYQHPLREMDFARTRLSYTTLQRADLQGALLHHTHWYRMNLEHLDLRHADMEGLRWDNNILESCDLRGARLRGAHFTECSLRQVQLQGADLRGAMMGCADLDTSQLEGCVYDDSTYWPEGFTPPPSAPF